MKMRKIKVQLDFGVTKKIHTLYDSFFNNPPKGIEYSKSEFKGINDKTYSKLGMLRKKLIKFFPSFEKLDKFFTSILRKEKNSDLIHFTFHLGKTKKPCVIDYEQAYNFIDIRDIKNEKNKKRAIKILNKKNVKYLMPINHEALKSFKLFFGDSIKKPQEVIYPTILVPEEFRKPVKKKNRVIFIGSANISTDLAFAVKGGYETILAFSFLAKKYKNYEFFVVSNIPEGAPTNKEENLIIKEILPQKELWKIMSQSKIFVQPNYHTPTMSFLEAMVFKLPIIAYDCWANKEYIEKNGVLIKPIELSHLDKNNIPIYTSETINIIKQNSLENSKLIIKAVEKLIENPSLVRKMGEAGYKKVKYGKFSTEERNKKLQKIYEDALNGI